MQRIALFLITLLLFSVVNAEAQRRGSTTYESLLRQSDQPTAYSDHIILPNGDGSYHVSVIFRLEYDFIPFLKKRPNMQPPADSLEYFSPVRMGVEIFEGEARSNRRSNSPSGTSVFRESWSDTVWVDSFEATRSRFDHVQGKISTELQPGTYHYQLQLARGGSERERPSQVRPLVIPAADDSETSEFILFSEFERQQESAKGELLNYGSNVLYGQNYTVLVRLPESNEEDLEERYQLAIRKGTADDKNTDMEPVFSETLTSDYMHRFTSSGITEENGDLILSLQTGNQGDTYAAVSVPNSNFENSDFTISLVDLKEDKKIAERPIRSRWIDMPVALYSLDVSIDLLRFIVSDRELREINSGSRAEREQKFREFWKERDPTPDTEFNELMDEYYRRIDYSYQNFSSLQSPGFDTDRGKAYILYGPPNSIDRRLLPDQPTREIWRYDNRELIFEAVSGVGDFRLISES